MRQSRGTKFREGLPLNISSNLRAGNLKRSSNLALEIAAGILDRRLCLGYFISRAVRAQILKARF
jgi:hypothetical protein